MQPARRPSAASLSPIEIRAHHAKRPRPSPDRDSPAGAGASAASASVGSAAERGVGTGIGSGVGTSLPSIHHLHPDLPPAPGHGGLSQSSPHLHHPSGHTHGHGHGLTQRHPYAAAGTEFLPPAASYHHHHQHPRATGAGAAAGAGAGASVSFFPSPATSGQPQPPSGAGVHVYDERGRDREQRRIFERPPPPPPLSLGPMYSSAGPTSPIDMRVMSPSYMGGDSDAEMFGEERTGGSASGMGGPPKKKRRRQALSCTGECLCPFGFGFWILDLFCYRIPSWGCVNREPVGRWATYSILHDSIGGPTSLRMRQSACYVSDSS